MSIAADKLDKTPWVFIFSALAALAFLVAQYSGIFSFSLFLSVL